MYGWSAKKVSGSVPSKSELTILIVFSFHTDHIFMRISAKERKKGGGDVDLSLSDKKIIDPVIIFFCWENLFFNTCYLDRRYKNDFLPEEVFSLLYSIFKAQFITLMLSVSNLNLQSFCLCV